MRVPSYRRHATGQATCRINGKDYYLGAYGTRESHERYHRLIAEWIAAGRPERWSQRSSLATITVAEVAERYAEHVGSVFGERHRARVQQTMRKWLLPTYGSTPAAEFGPLALRAARQGMVTAGVARSTINVYVSMICRAFKWAVAEELLPASVHDSLRALGWLPKGRGAKEYPEVGPVPAHVLEATLRCLRDQYATIARLQVLTGMRPGEACAMRVRDLLVTGEVWTYRPARHKTAHLGRQRIILIGPQAQQLLRPYLNAAKGTDAPLFPRRAGGGDPVRSRAYYYAVQRACRRAGVEPWHPHQLRHSAATNLLAETGNWEAVRTILGHSKPDTTAIYAERDRAQAEAVIRRLG